MDAATKQRLKDIALDVAVLVVFVFAWWSSRSFDDIVRWFPSAVTIVTIVIASVKLISDLTALAMHGHGTAPTQEQQVT